MKKWEAFMQGGASLAKLELKEAQENGWPVKPPAAPRVGVYPVSEQLGAGFGALSGRRDA
jgi:hypothetical protein